ncbi:MAG: hypothetical protein KatS3mg076_0358 [Candidatus Binatia bacterium]|nr:MAG: hypothetical protein KatS3mg076_0358 [Candidatus Binatia bacterium]
MPVLSPPCAVRGDSGWRTTARWRERVVRLDCGEKGLGGRLLGPFEGDVLVEVPGRAGERVFLGRGTRAWRIPANPERPGGLGTFLRMGFWHVLSGPDHLLFLLGLVLLCPRVGSLAWTVTAFTAGHATTLALVTLGVVRFPARLAEVGIAASLVVVALELGRRPERRAPPVALAFPFGLLHGLGFANAFSTLGLAGPALVASVGVFHVGIEGAQLLLVACARTLRMRPGPWSPARADTCARLVIGSLGVFWVLERLGTAALLRRFFFSPPGLP